jgi:hypothetical protein
MTKNNWYWVGLNAWSLGLEASSVIALRTAKLLAGGTPARREARRMVSEKIRAAMTLQALALTGRLGTSTHRAAAKTLTHYRTKVRANRRRLIKR